jgi:hypothetical protein
MSGDVSDKIDADKAGGRALICRPAGEPRSRPMGYIPMIKNLMSDRVWAASADWP